MSLQFAIKNSPYSKDSVRQGLLHYLLGRGLSGLAGFATVILLVRYMDVQSYAGFTALSGAIAMAGVLAGLGLDRVISRYIPEARLEQSTKVFSAFIWRITTIKLFASILVSLIFYVFWSQVLRLFPDVHLLNFPISLVCFVIAETLFQHFSSIFQALVKQKVLTQILIIQWAGRLVMIAWTLFGNNYIGLEESLWIMAIPEAIGVLAFIFVIKQYLNSLEKEQGQIKPSTDQWPDWNALFKMAGHNYGFSLLAAPPQGYFMKMLAGIFLPTQMVAAYGFFINIAERARQYIPLHLFYNLIEPIIIGKYLENRDFPSLIDRCQLLYKSNLLMLVPVLAWLAATGTFAIAMLTGGKYQEYSWVLLLVMLQLTVGSHVVLLQLILNSIKASNQLVKAAFFALIVMTFFLIITMLISVNFLVVGPLVFSLACNAYIINAMKIQGTPYVLSKKVFKGVILSGVMAFATGYAVNKLDLYHFNQPAFAAIVYGVFVACVYMLFLHLFRVIKQDEVDLIRSLFDKKKKRIEPSSEATNFNDFNIVSQLQSHISNVLDKIIPNDAHIILLDYPNTTNIGDSLIWLGEIAYLRYRGIKPEYVCDIKNYNPDNIKKLLNKKSIILMHGGGNFGTMWHEIHAFRLQVLRDFPQVPIVQLPQTIYFDDETHVQEIAELIRTHSSYTLLTRSQVSHKFALQHFSANVHLCPDMAFFIGKINSSNPPHLDYFVLARTDHEKAINLLKEIKSHFETSNYETTDWLQPSWQERLLHRVEIHTTFLRSGLDPHNKALLCLWNQLSYLRLKRGVSLLSRGRIVVTDRLHVHILSILLNKPHLIIDNVYGKLSDFYKTWTSANAETVFVKDVENLIIATNELELAIDQKINTVRASK